MPEEGRLGSVARRLAATRRILVVEDEHDIAEFLRAYFRASGYDLVHLDPETALQVLEAIDEHRPDCVLLDLQLRGFTGETAYRLIRTEHRYDYLPILIVSARPDARSVVHPGGLDAAVAKPFNANTLADLVADRIRRSGELRTEAGDERSGLHPHGYVEARLTDALSLGDERPVAFALARLRTASEVEAAVGPEGASYVLQQIARRAVDALPADTVVGRTSGGDVALLIPDMGAASAEQALRALVGSVGTEVVLPGGAAVPVKLAIGLATHPEHADEPDELYMAADAALADAVEGDLAVRVAV